jgi:hypothetical protein
METAVEDGRKEARQGTSLDLALKTKPRLFPLERIGAHTTTTPQRGVEREERERDRERKRERETLSVTPHLGSACKSRGPP